MERQAGEEEPGEGRGVAGRRPLVRRAELSQVRGFSGVAAEMVAATAGAPSRCRAGTGGWSCGTSKVPNSWSIWGGGMLSMVAISREEAPIDRSEAGVQVDLRAMGAG